MKKVRGVHNKTYSPVLLNEIIISIGIFEDIENN